MTGSNKILTVSYGTFSCTLEGFDDPFGTMRGIAEYFRDLAADDRYFGAEPPTPDVEMLQNIAQGEVRRRVEARVGDNNVALRQVETETKPPKSEPVAQADLVEADEETLEHGPLALDDDYLMADEPEDVLTVDTSARPAETAPAETVAEKLRRIRAVVSRTHTPEAADDEPSSEKAPAADAGSDDVAVAAYRDRALTETIASITADLAEQDDVESLGAARSDTAEEIVEYHAGEPEAQDAAPLETETAEAADLPPEAEFEAEEAPSEEETAEMVRADEPVLEDEPPLHDEATEPADLLSEAASAQETVRYDEDDEAEANFFGPTADTDTVYDDDPDMAPEETDLTSESAEHQTDDDMPVRDDPQQLGSEHAADKPQTDRRSTKPLVSLGEANGDVGRLLAETDNKLNEDEGIRRRRVISQMRAAVAATKAERTLKGDPASKEEQDHEQQNVYRKVLSEVVSSRPLDDTAKIGSSAERSAPLILVSSQRVDTVQAQEQDGESDERPDHPETRETSGFAKFAEKVGASELPDLLEAAAAYAAFVEGQPHFSRPEIMKRVARFDPTMNLSREAGLRSFGQLLRQGKIQKLQRGQFTISEDTRFNPSQRFAGE